MSSNLYHQLMTTGQKLDLQDRRLTIEDIKDLCRALPETTINNLDLSSNNLGDGTFIADKCPTCARHFLFVSSPSFLSFPINFHHPLSTLGLFYTQNSKKLAFHYCPNYQILFISTFSPT